MGFSFGGMLSGAISGAASGFMMGGGPYGAIAGGVIGGASGGFGGPSSIGGITGSDAGKRAGEGAAAYYDAAFPGTNPWERLGAGNPMGPMSAAGIAAKTSQSNVGKQVAGQRLNVMAQTGAQVKVAQIQAATQRYHTKVGANVAAMGHAENRAPGSFPALATSLHGDATPGHGISTPGGGRLDVLSRQTGAEASMQQVDVARGRLLVEAERVITEKGKAFRSPEIAALASKAVQTFDYGQKDPAAWDKHLSQGWFKIYLAAGVAAHVIERGAEATGKVLGARTRPVGGAGNRFPSKTSVRPRPPSGGEKSAPRGYRPPGPDAATAKSRKYWMKQGWPE